MVAAEPARDAGYVMLFQPVLRHWAVSEAERMRRAMAEHGVKKAPGCSWVEVKGDDVKAFVSGFSQDLDHTGFVRDVIRLLDCEMVRKL